MQPIMQILRIAPLAVFKLRKGEGSCLCAGGPPVQQAWYVGGVEDGGGSFSEFVAAVPLLV